ncbi:MAG: YiiX/YebB-like N1pC/P60 family cysteine hydrolase [Woeseiaceae bacterium]|nr:YiiX/YebB-like N1pC/P60 family cysteine hydrolase [Woeseiaceae bacterium]
MKQTIIRAVVGLLIVAGLASAVTYIYVSSNIEEQELACFDALAEVLHAGADPDQMYVSELERLQLLVERSLVVRSQMLEIANRLRVNKDLPLASRDLVTLKGGSEYYLEMREELYELATAYECASVAEPETMARYNISPELRLKALMLSLGAALTLYDNYMLGIVLFEQDDRLRRVLNDPDMGFGLIANKLAEATLAANSIENRARARQAIEFYETEKSLIVDVDEDSDFAYLQQLIETSPSYNYVKKIRVGEIASNKFVAFERLTGDAVSEATKDGFDLVSGLFGNTVGLYESRKGKLYGDDEALRKIQSVLQPLDIILEKTPFRLTDKLIPGHFGHVAIWTGTKAELVDAGVWDNLIISQYADEISSTSNPDSKDEQQIIEALRNGVQLSTLEHFLNVDDIAILRPVFSEDNKDELVEEALLMAFRQVGKKYDFNFDVNTTDKIVCSELAYISFPSMDWPTEETLGRHSISPDNVAQLAWNNVPLQLVLFYHDGVLVDAEDQARKLRELMSE